MRFTATQDFFSEETKSQYVEGLSYTVRDEKLAALAKQWLKEGKITLAEPAAKVEGKG